jgi:hypothetical protein
VFVGEALNVRFRQGHSFGEIAKNRTLYDPDYFGLPEGFLDALMQPRGGGITSLLPQVGHAKDPNEPERSKRLSRALFAITLVNDFHVWLTNTDVGTRVDVVAALDRFGPLDRAVVHPWWERKAVLAAPSGLKTTAYVVDERILLVVANWGDEQVTGEIQLSPRDLPLLRWSFPHCGAPQELQAPTGRIVTRNVRDVDDSARPLDAQSRCGGFESYGSDAARPGILIIDTGEQTVRLPDFLIVGAARCGTTTIYYHLRQHPRVFMPDLKEPFFLTFLGEKPPYSELAFLRERTWTLRDYARLFAPARDDQIAGEASTSYLYLHERTISHIKGLYGDRASELRIIVVLRNPADRTFSNYLLLRSNGWDDLTFEQFLDRDFTRSRLNRRWDYDYVGLGSYYQGVKAYLECFPHTRIHLYEDLRNPQSLLDDLFAFLGVEPLVDAAVTLRSNPAGLPRSPAAASLLDLMARIASPLARVLPDRTRIQMARLREHIRARLLDRPTLSRESRLKLIEIFRGDIERLQELLKRDLSSWLIAGDGP